MLLWSYFRVRIVFVFFKLPAFLQDSQPTVMFFNSFILQCFCEIFVLEINLVIEHGAQLSLSGKSM